MKTQLLPLGLLTLCLSATLIAQDAQQVTLRFLSFPKNANPQPVELLIGEGETIEVKDPTKYRLRHPERP